MKTIGGVLLLVTLTFGAGCAKSDWIDRTLVTVDVTGVWEGTQTPHNPQELTNPIELVLEQKGAKVTGKLKFRNFPTGTMPIEGTVSGDTFSFHKANPGPKMDAVLQVKGEEMTGEGQTV